MIALGYFFSIAYALLCLLIGFAAYKLGAPKKITRKIVHILVGFEWLILYHFFGGGAHFLAVCLIFTALLSISHFKKLLPMIESSEDNSPGTIYYGIAMSVMALITLFVPDMIIPFGIGVFCTSLGDGLAGLAGQWIKSPRNAKIYGSKTFYGSYTNILVCFIVAGVFNGKFDLGLSVWYILAIAFFATELELFTGKGLDNITVTLGTSFLSYLLIHFDRAGEYIIPILFTPLMIAFAYKKKALSTGGIIAAIIVDILISLAFGNFGFVMLLAFFLGGIITDKIKNRHKNKGRKEKRVTECRSYVQVLANSLTASICALCYLFTKQNLFVIAFVASLAEALADTAASGIGVLSGRAYDPFRRRPCTPGLSGGMSILGTVASVLAALLMSLIALCFGSIDHIDVAVITLASTLGAIFDSLLGSLLQVKFKCPKCGEITESKEHCSTPTTRYSGITCVTNNTVNLLSTIFSAILAGLLYYIIM